VEEGAKGKGKGASPAPRRQSRGGSPKLPLRGLDFPRVPTTTNEFGIESKGGGLSSRRDESLRMRLTLASARPIGTSSLDVATGRSTAACLAPAFHPRSLPTPVTVLFLLNPPCSSCPPAASLSAFLAAARSLSAPSVGNGPDATNVLPSKSTGTAGGADPVSFCSAIERARREDVLSSDAPDGAGISVESTDMAGRCEGDGLREAAREPLGEGPRKCELGEREGEEGRDPDDEGSSSRREAARRRVATARLRAVGWGSGGGGGALSIVKATGD
jgi:hypothetical protein